MDNQLNPHITLPEAPQVQKKNARKGFLFFEVGLFEIGFVTILLVIIFGVLNYFHILNLSSQIRQLSFLPTQTTPTPVPIPTALINDSIIKYIQESMQSTFLPTDIRLVQIKKKVTGFQADWVTKKIPFKAIAVYDTYQTQLQYMEIVTNTSFTKDQISSSSAEMIASTFYKTQPLSTWNCGPASALSQGFFCNTITYSSAGKKGITIASFSASSSATAIVSCFIPPKSKSYISAVFCSSLGL